MNPSQAEFRQALRSLASSGQFSVRIEFLESELSELSPQLPATKRCLTEVELREWPRLSLPRVVHARVCAICSRITHYLIRPDFLAAAERMASRHGVTAQEILDEQLQQLDRCDHPKRDCLNPFEFALLESGSLPDYRITHLEGCSSCAALAQLMVRGR